MLTSDIETIMAWKSKELSGESNTPFTGLGNSVAPELKQIHNSKITVEFKGNSLKQDKATFTRRNMANLFIAYELDTWSRDLSTKFTLGDLVL